MTQVRITDKKHSKISRCLAPVIESVVTFEIVMGSSSKGFRQFIGALLLLAFFANESVSLLAGPKIRSIAQTAVYQFNESVQGIPFSPTESPVPILVALFCIVIVPSFYYRRGAELIGVLLIPLRLRNPFYYNITINAP